MPGSKRLGDPPGAADDLHANLTGVRRREEALRGVREQFEEDVVSWISELAAVTATMLGARRDRRLSGARIGRQSQTGTVRTTPLIFKVTGRG